MSQRALPPLGSVLQEQEAGACLEAGPEQLLVGAGTVWERRFREARHGTAQAAGVGEGALATHTGQLQEPFNLKK